jgi:hypothetical protein
MKAKNKKMAPKYEEVVLTYPIGGYYPERGHEFSIDGYPKLKMAIKEITERYIDPSDKNRICFVLKVEKV